MRGPAHHSGFDTIPYVMAQLICPKQASPTIAVWQARSPCTPPPQGSTPPTGKHGFPGPSGPLHSGIEGLLTSWHWNISIELSSANPGYHSGLLKMPVVEAHSTCWKHAVSSGLFGSRVWQAVCACAATAKNRVNAAVGTATHGIVWRDGRGEGRGFASMGRGVSPRLADVQPVVRFKKVAKAF
jgi:hypothetical protein